jgi:hypothetical protein
MSAVIAEQGECGPVKPRFAVKSTEFEDWEK